MAVDDEVILRVVGRYQAQNIVNTLHFKITAQTLTEQEILQALVEAWDGATSAAWAARHIDTYELIGVKMFSKSGANKVPGFVVSSTAGGVVGEEVPSPVCRTITLYTESDNYRRRGRVMLSGGAVSMFNTDDGGVTDVEVLALGTLATQLLEPVVSDNETMVPIIPSTDLLDLEPIVAAVPRHTPSLIGSRRIRQFLIG